MKRKVTLDLHDSLCGAKGGGGVRKTVNGNNIINKPTVITIKKGA